MSGPFPRPVVVAIALVGLLALGVFAYFGFRGPDDNTRRMQPTAASAPLGGLGVAVETARVEATEMTIEATAVGSLRANESVVLRPETAGRIASINFRDGATVSKDSLLIALDATTQAAAVDQARANLALAQANHQRNQDLFERKFISRQALDSTQAGLRVQEAALALAQAHFDKMRIRAPFSGIVGIRRVDVGDYVKEGQDLVNLEDIGTLKIDFRLPETTLSRLRAGQPIEVASDALPGQTFPAVVEAINPLVEAGGRAIALRAAMSNAHAQLRPGMFVRVRLLFERRPNVLLVPEQAVVPDSNTPYLYRVTAGHAQKIPVRTGLRRAGKVEISEGLSAGDEIVVAGQLKLHDGMAVRPLGESKANGSPETGSAAPSTASPAETGKAVLRDAPRS